MVGPFHAQKRRPGNTHCVKKLCHYRHLELIRTSYLPVCEKHARGLSSYNAARNISSAMTADQENH